METPADSLEDSGRASTFIRVCAWFLVICLVLATLGTIYMAISDWLQGHRNLRLHLTLLAVFVTSWWLFIGAAWRIARTGRLPPSPI